MLPSRERFATPAARTFNPGHSIETSWFVCHVVDALRPHAAQDAAQEIGDSDAALDELNRYCSLALETLRGALSVGWDTARGGGILYMMDICGKPFVDATVVADGKLWWPLCEALYACTYVARRASARVPARSYRPPSSAAPYSLPPPPLSPATHRPRAPRARSYALEITGDWRWLDDITRVYGYIRDHILDQERGGAWWGYLHRDGSVANAAKGGNFKGCFHVPRALLFAVQSADRILHSAAEPHL